VSAQPWLHSDLRHRRQRRAPILVAGGGDNQLIPDISGTIVVWQDDSGPNSQVRYRDLAGGTEQPVVTGGTASPERAPQISGRRVVWQQQQNGSWDIDLKNL
jgi:hypothetical protein